MWQIVDPLENRAMSLNGPRHQHGTLVSRGLLELHVALLFPWRTFDYVNVETQGATMNTIFIDFAVITIAITTFSLCYYSIVVALCIQNTKIILSTQYVLFLYSIAVPCMYILYTVTVLCNSYGVLF